MHWRALLIILLLSWNISAFGQTCSSVLLPYGARYEMLAQKSFISDWQILKAAQIDVVGDRTLTEKALESITSFLDVFRLDSKYREKIEIEIRRRQYEKAVKEMGAVTYRDPRYFLKNNKHYFSILFSIAANSMVNFISYHYLGHAGVIVHLPSNHIFKPENIPDEVLQELLLSPDNTPATKKYLNLYVRHDADVVLNNIRKYFNIGILGCLVVFHSDAVIHPELYLKNQIIKGSEAVSSLAVATNLETIKRLEIKKIRFEQEGEMEKAQIATQLIKKIETEIGSLSQ